MAKTARANANVKTAQNVIMSPGNVAVQSELKGSFASLDAHQVREFHRF